MGMSGGQFGGISSVTQIEKLRAFDHATSGNVETSNDSFSQHLQITEVFQDCQSG
jgi:hypothetical protein